jgi:hypothetical protein
MCVYLMIRRSGSSEFGFNEYSASFKMDLETI